MLVERPHSTQSKSSKMSTISRPASSQSRSRPKSRQGNGLISDACSSNNSTGYTSKQMV